eukprot:633048-Hanusia_phi.AAC.5
MLEKRRTEGRREAKRRGANQNSRRGMNGEAEKKRRVVQRGMRRELLAARRSRISWRWSRGSRRICPAARPSGSSNLELKTPGTWSRTRRTLVQRRGSRGTWPTPDSLRLSSSSHTAPGDSSWTGRGPELCGDWGNAWDDVRRLKKMRVECKELLQGASDQREVLASTPKSTCHDNINLLAIDVRESPSST